MRTGWELDDQIWMGILCSSSHACGQESPNKRVKLSSTLIGILNMFNVDENARSGKRRESLNSHQL